MVAAIVAMLSLLGGYTASERFNVDAGTAPHVSVWTETGSIVLTTAGSTVEVEAVKKAATRGDLGLLHVEANREGNDVSIRAAGEGGCKGGCGGVSFVVRVPAGATVDLRTITGNIDVSGLSADAHIASSAGSIAAYYARTAGVRSIQMSTSIGRVTLSLPGDTLLRRVRARTLVGRINCSWPLDPANALFVGARAARNFGPNGVDVDLSTTIGGVYLMRG